MNTADWIQLIVGIITACGVLSSISISLNTLKQNSQLIEDSTRPNVIIYKDVLDINSPMEYLVIKNIGNSIAHITSINFDEQKISKLNKDFSDLNDALFKLNNSYLAPKQFYKIPMKTQTANFDEVSFDISYCSSVKKYQEVFTVNIKQDYGIKFTKQHQPNNELKVISNAIQELIKRLS